MSWYERARGLGFPKCPIPIFFRFSIKDVLFKPQNICCISDGNMQSASTSFGSLDSMIDKFGFNDLFYTQKYATKDDYNRYRDFSQQEFLVKNELVFNDINDFEIVCQSEEDRELLTSLIGNENSDIFKNIIIDRSYYNNENPRINVYFANDEININSEFNGPGYLNLYIDQNFDKSNIQGGDVQKITNEKIIFNSHLSMNNYKASFKLTFIDESKREWLYMKNNSNIWL